MSCTTHNLSKIETQNGQICQVCQYCQCSGFAETVQSSTRTLFTMLFSQGQINNA